MKLRGKILCLAIVPVALIGLLISVLTGQKVKEAITAELNKSLEANAISLMNAIEMDTTGDYKVDSNGELYKGEFNVTHCQGLLDEVKEKTGIEMSIFYGDERYVTSVLNEDGTRAIGTKASEEVVEEVLNKGNLYQTDDAMVNGVEYYAYYVPYFNEGSDTPVGMIFAGDLKSKVDKHLLGVIQLILVISVVVCVGGIVAILLIAGRLSKALKRATNVVEEVSNGNLTVQVVDKDQKRKDEIGKIGKSMNDLLSGLYTILNGFKDQTNLLKEAAASLNATSQNTKVIMTQVESAVQDIAQGANSQAQETQRATENVIFMGNMVEQTSTDVVALHENAKIMKTMSQQAAETLTQLQSITKKSTRSIEDIYHQTITTNESALKIKEATELITSIADETNLLSLNASIEAARAGEAGRGFAVVASQIQKLAEQSNDSARKIDEIINSLLNDSTKAVKTMQEVKVITNEQNENVNKVDEIFEEVIVGIEQSINSVESIAEKTEQLDSARVNVVDVVSNLTAIAEENAASTEESAASIAEVNRIVTEIAESADQLSQIVDVLNETISIFQF